MMTAPDCLILGAGAAGCFAAIHLKETHPDLTVWVVEAGARPLQKVKISGGGRCNVTHHCFDLERFAAAYPRGARQMRHQLRTFGPADTIAWFKARGVSLKAEPDGRMFPTTDDSQTIIDCLLGEMRRLGVRLILNTHVQALTPTSSGYTLRLTSPHIPDTLHVPRLVIATGSNPRVWQLLAALGQPIIPAVPSLFTLTVPDAALHAMAGAVLPHATVSLPQLGKKLAQTGPVLLTHWGLSGPATLKLSAFAARELHAARYRTEAHLDLFPHLTTPAMAEALDVLWRDKAKSQLKNVSPAMAGGAEAGFPQRFWEQYLIPRLGLDPQQQCAHLSRPQRQAILDACKRLPLPVSGKGVFKEEFVTAGGVDLKGMNLATMESKILPGVYVIGEALNIDGITGGFNFQNAWTSAKMVKF